MMKVVSLISLLLITAHAMQYDEDTTRGEITHLTEGGGGRWTIPAGCTDDCRYVEWIPQEINGEMYMRFTITGSSNGYVAVAISADDTMGNDDAYICSRTSIFSTEIRIQSAYLTGFTFPIINFEITDDEGSETNLTETHLTCSFLRPFNVTKNVAGSQRSWDIETTNYYLLFAQGYVTEEGDFYYHDERTASPTLFNLVSNDSIELDSQINQNLSKIPLNPQDVIIANTENGGSWLVPSDECPLGGCKNIQWEPIKGPDGQLMMQFTMLGSSQGWIGMAISSDELMGDDDCYYCARENSTSSTVHIISAYLAGRARPVPIERVHHSKVFLASVEDGLMVCKFLRPINVTKSINGSNVTWDLSQSRFNLFYAEGSVSNRDGSISYHSFRRRTHGSFYFLSNEGYARRDATFYMRTLSTTSTIPPSITTPSTYILPEENVERSPSGGGRWTFPTGCLDRCRSLEWEPVVRNKEDSVQITMSGAGKDYIGFLIATELTAASGDCYFCIRNPLNSNEVLIKSGFCAPNTAPTNLENISSERIVRAEATENSLSCAFYRPLSLRKTVNEEVIFYDLAHSSYVLIYEEGRAIDERGIAPPNYSAFTPNPFTLINETLFRQVQGETKSISSNNIEFSTKSYQDLETSTGGSERFHLPPAFLVILLNTILFYILRIVL